MKKVYVDDTKQITIVCPKCGFTTSINISNLTDKKKKLKAKCKCREVFEFTLEFRKHYRKDVRLPGEYVVQKSGEKGEIIVENLSLGGIQFATLRRHQISTDDALELKFKLDNSMRTEIRRSAKVVWVGDRSVGVQYVGPKLFEKDLGFYLRS
jgi:hypothetical protein